MKLCVFQGTFNPIHNAHLRMAEFILNEYKFDKILFIPAYRPPHKDYDEGLSKHRLEMVKLAVKTNENFEISDIEYNSERPSYTYLTIKELYKIYDVDDKINFIIGTDAFKDIDKWYEAEKLKPLLKFIVFKRANEFTEEIKNCEFEYTTMPFYDVSSTEIREKIKNGEDISNYVTKEVKRYIEENGLYK